VKRLVLSIATVLGCLIVSASAFGADLTVPLRAARPDVEAASGRLSAAPEWQRHSLFSRRNA
jgi:hypothetical protein